MRNKYLTVGTDIISPILFKDIADNKNIDNIKPNGGLWLTEFNEDMPICNVWIWFLVSHINIWFYKNFRKKDIFNTPCSVVKLKEDSNIFILDTKSSLDYLFINYPSLNGWFSSETLSYDFDGIFIDLNHLKNDNLSDDELNKISSFAVNTLLLFNYSCIEYYQPAKLRLEPFDFEFGFSEEDINLSMEISSEKKHVYIIDTLYDNLISKICDYIVNYCPSYINFSNNNKFNSIEVIIDFIKENFSKDLDAVLSNTPELHIDDLCDSVLRKLEKKDI